MHSPKRPPHDPERDVHGTPDTGLADTQIAHSSGRVFETTGVSVGGMTSSAPPVIPISGKPIDGSQLGGTVTDSGRARKKATRRASTIERSERYDVVGERARGGLGRILEARDDHLGRTVAIKELLRASTFAESLFVREALITARLQHPGIVPVHEAGRWPSGDPYYVMKLLSGNSLQTLIRKQETLAERMSLLPNVIAVVETIAYAHSQRVIHRDIKPANIMVGKFGETIVVDWGLARDDKQPVPPINETVGGLPGGLPGHLSSELSAGLGQVEFAAPTPAPPSDSPRPTSRSTPRSTEDGWRISGNYSVSGKVVGTPAYMSPEQARGEDVDERTDVYALGALLYEVLTGRPPYPGRKLQEVLDQVLAGPPEPLDRRLAKSGEQVKADILTIVDKAMARDRDDRYPSAAELAADLKRFQTGQLVSVHQYSAFTLVKRWLRRHRAELAIAAAAAVLLAITGVLSVKRIIEEKDIAEAQRAHAQAAQRLTEDKHREMIFMQAEGALDKDPTAAVAWLKDAQLEGVNLERGRSLFEGARAQGIARHVVRLTDSPTGATYLPDGQHLVVSGKDGLVRLLDSETGSAEVLADIGEAVTFSLVSPDGRWVAAGDYSGAIHLIDMRARDQSGAPIAHTWKTHKQFITSLRFSTDSRLLATAGADSTVVIRDVETGQSVFTRKLMAGATVTPDFRWIALVVPLDEPVVDIAADQNLHTARKVHGKEFAIALIDRRTGRETRRIAISDWATELLFSPDGRFIATYSKASLKVHLIDTQAPADQAVKHLGFGGYMVGPGRALTFSPSGRYLAVVGGEYAVDLWEIETRTKRSLRGHQGVIYNVLFTADEQAVISVSDDATARIYDVKSNDVRVLKGHTDDIKYSAIHPQGDELATLSLDGSVRIWPLRRSEIARLSTGQTMPFQNHIVDNDTLIAMSTDGKLSRWKIGTEQFTEITAMEFVHWENDHLSPDGKSVYGFIKGKQLELVVASTESGEQRNLGPMHWDEIQAIEWTANGSHLVLSIRGGQVKSWAVGTEAWQPIKVARDMCSAQLAPGGGQLAVLHPDRVELRNPADGALLATIPVPDGLEQKSHPTCNPAGHTTPPRYSPDGKYLAFRYLMDGLLVMNIDSREFAYYKLSGTKIATFAFSNHGTHIAANPMDRSTYLIDVRTGKERKLGYHGDRVYQYRFSPDDGLLAASSHDHTVRIWNLHNGGSRVLRGHSDGVFGVSFTPDGKRLASSSLDATVRIWDLTEQRIDTADQLLGLVRASTSAIINDRHKLETRVGGQ